MASESALLKLRFEIIGGMSGRAAKQVIEINLSELGQDAADELRHAVESLPQSAWGHSFLSEYPKPWDSLQILTIEEMGHQKSITFHRHEGPPELIRLADRIVQTSH